MVLDFRSRDFDCFKKGGKQCYAITGENQYYFSVMGLGVCVMSHPSDLAPALIALDSELEIASPSGIRRVPIEKFFNGARDVFETILKPDEFVVSINVPNPPVRSRMAYLKNSVRPQWDFALRECCGIARVSGDVCLNSRLVLGGLAPFPYRAIEAEERLRNTRIDEKVAQEAAEKAVRKARGLSNNEYKVQLGFGLQDARSWQR